MADIVDRMHFDSVRCEVQFSKGVARNIEEGAAEITRLRAIEKAARTYYHNYCQDEANEEGICDLAQQLDAIALRDALAVEQSQEK